MVELLHYKKSNKVPVPSLFTLTYKMLFPRINSPAKQIRQILLGLHFTYHHLFSDQDAFMILDNYKSVRTDYFWNRIEKPIEQTFNSLKEILTSDAPS